MELLHVVAGMQTDIGIIAERCSRNAPLVQFPETVGLESGGHSSQRDLGIGLDLGQVLLHLGIALGHCHQLLAGTGDGNLPTPQDIRHRGVGTDTDTDTDTLTCAGNWRTPCSHAVARIFSISIIKPGLTGDGQAIGYTYMVWQGKRGWGQLSMRKL